MGLHTSYGSEKSCVKPTQEKITQELNRLAKGDLFTLDTKDLGNYPKLVQTLQDTLDTHKVDVHKQGDTTHREAHIFKISAMKRYDGNDLICFSSSFSKVEVSTEGLSPELYQAILSSKFEENPGLLGLFQIALPPNEL